VSNDKINVLIFLYYDSLTQLWLTS